MEKKSSLRTMPIVVAVALLLAAAIFCWFKFFSAPGLPGERLLAFVPESADFVFYADIGAFKSSSLGRSMEQKAGKFQAGKTLPPEMSELEKSGFFDHLEVIGYGSADSNGNKGFVFTYTGTLDELGRLIGPAAVKTEMAGREALNIGPVAVIMLEEGVFCCLPDNQETVPERGYGLKREIASRLPEIPSNATLYAVGVNLKPAATGKNPPPFDMVAYIILTGDGDLEINCDIYNLDEQSKNAVKAAPGLLKMAFASNPDPKVKQLIELINAIDIKENGKDQISIRIELAEKDLKAFGDIVATQKQIQQNNATAPGNPR